MAITLRAAVIMFAVQAAVLLGLTILMMTWAVAERTDYRGWVLIGSVLVLVAACALTGYGLARRAAAARGVGIGLALLTAVPASYMAGGGNWYGWALAAWSLALVVFLVAPATGRALGVPN